MPNEGGLHCWYPGCQKVCPTRAGLTRHFAIHGAHALARGQRAADNKVAEEMNEPFNNFLNGASPPRSRQGSAQAEGPRSKRIMHPNASWAYFSTGERANPVEDEAEQFETDKALEDNAFYPFHDQPNFKAARFLMNPGGVMTSERRVEEFQDVLESFGNDLQFKTKDQLLELVNDIPGTHLKWEETKLTVPNTDERSPSYMRSTYLLFHRDLRDVVASLIGNRDFAADMDYAPYREYDHNGERIFSEMASGECWLRRQGELPEGATACPLICASDETVLSILKGNNSAWPVYLSIGNIRRGARYLDRRRGLILIGYLPIPEDANEDEKHTERYRSFSQQLFHATLQHIFRELAALSNEGMFVQCADGFYRQVYPFLATWIADYPEQALLAGVLRGRCPCCYIPLKERGHNIAGSPRCLGDRELLAQHFNITELRRQFGYRKLDIFVSQIPDTNIHSILTSDLLHQLLKGLFIEHLVQWINGLIEQEHGKDGLDELSCRLRATPYFPGLRLFYDGVNFSKWTATDAQNLISIYTPAITGLAKARFYNNLKAFDPVHKGNYNFPKMHSIQHYREDIEEFGALDGLNSEHTERNHQAMCKDPWRSSNKCRPEFQMLQRVYYEDIFRQKEVYLQEHGLLQREVRTAKGVRNRVFNEIEGCTLASRSYPGYPKTIAAAAIDEGIVGLQDHVRRYLLSLQFRAQHPPPRHNHTSLLHAPAFDGVIKRRPGARIKWLPHPIARCDGSLISHYLRATERWTERRTGRAQTRWDCVLIDQTTNKRARQGLLPYRPARVLLFFSFEHDGQTHEVALIEWFSFASQEPDPVTGLFQLKPSIIHHHNERKRDASVISLSDIVRSTLIIPRWKSQTPEQDRTEVLDTHDTFWLNAFSDRDAFLTMAAF
ncbi:hypothetical protein BT69DRAFT_1338409 [Atractiella rhizophila]|nr:hypothetical protein BT69DRAFT_1338409 [Atractiella rhizophila]